MTVNYSDISPFKTLHYFGFEEIAIDQEDNLLFASYKSQNSKDVIYAFHDSDTHQYKFFSLLKQKPVAHPLEIIATHKLVIDQMIVNQIKGVKIDVPMLQLVSYDDIIRKAIKISKTDFRLNNHPDAEVYRFNGQLFTLLNLEKPRPFLFLNDYFFETLLFSAACLFRSRDQKKLLILSGTIEDKLLTMEPLEDVFFANVNNLKIPNHYDSYRIGILLFQQYDPGLKVYYECKLQQFSQLMNIAVDQYFVSARLLGSNLEIEIHSITNSLKLLNFITSLPYEFEKQMELESDDLFEVQIINKAVRIQSPMRIEILQFLIRSISDLVENKKVLLEFIDYKN